jgi:putative endonuclease
MKSILRNFLNRSGPVGEDPAHLSLGKRGEELAVRHLKSQGYRIVVTNFLAPIGYSFTGRQMTAEIDIIAYDESSEPFTLAFIEVKTRSSIEVAAPEAAVDLRKQRHITRAARVYRRLMNLSDEPYRFDVISIVFPPYGEEDRKIDINLLRGYFREQRFEQSGWHQNQI